MILETNGTGDGGKSRLFIKGRVVIEEGDVRTVDVRKRVLGEDRSRGRSSEVHIWSRLDGQRGRRGKDGDGVSNSGNES